MAASSISAGTESSIDELQTMTGMVFTKIP